MLAPPLGPRLTLGTYGPPLLGRPFVLGPSEVATHKHVIGVTGQGKSKLLASMFVQLMNQGIGAALIDPHADLAKDVLGILADTGFFKRQDAYERLLYVDFSDKERFLPFNVLNQPYDDHTVAKNIVEACKRAWPVLADGSAPQFENILLAGSLALIQNKRPLPDLPKLLTDQDFRNELLTNMSDQAIVDFFHARFDKWGRDAATMIESTLRRAFLLTFSPSLRYSLGQTANALDFRKLMDTGTCVLFNLGGLDEDTQKLLGCLITVGFEVAALSRAELLEHERKQYHLILDEFSMFSAQSEESLARVLSLARKYGLYLTLAHQTWSQISTRLHGALQNAVEISFKLGRSDAQSTAPRFARYEPWAVKHEVVDPLQADRSHPVFFNIQEQMESWTQALVDLQPREVFIKTTLKSARVRTLAVQGRGTSHEEIAAIVGAYRDLLLVPKPTTESLRREKSTEPEVVRVAPLSTRKTAEPDPTTRWITVRYASSCIDCGKTLPQGVHALYEPSNRALQCEACAAVSTA